MTIDDFNVYKWAKWVAYGIIAAAVITIAALSIAVGVKNKTIKRLNNRIDWQAEEVAYWMGERDSLAKLDCITVTANIIINQKGLVNLNQATQISKTVATYTREEALLAIDSLRKLNDDGTLQPQ
jgi:uncharacterized membrane protein YcjF (UPF0283 family)